MPIYEYACQACGEEIEKLQKISDPPLTDCPACGKPALSKKVSAAGFRLKGGGWYETDFKSGGKKNLASDTKKGDDKDSKPAAEKSGTSSDGTKKPSSEAA